MAIANAVVDEINQNVQVLDAASSPGSYKATWLHIMYKPSLKSFL